MTQHKEALVNSTTHIQKKPRLRDRTDRAWFSHRVRHPARKWSRSILTTPETTRCPNIITACGKTVRKWQKNPFINSAFYQCLDTLPVDY